MKEYVFSFANDEIKLSSPERADDILTALDSYTNGFITAFETIKLIVDSYYKRSSNNHDRQEVVLW